MESEASRQSQAPSRAENAQAAIDHLREALDELSRSVQKRPHPLSGGSVLFGPPPPFRGDVLAHIARNADAVARSPRLAVPDRGPAVRLATWARAGGAGDPSTLAADLELQLLAILDEEARGPLPTGAAAQVKAKRPRQRSLDQRAHALATAWQRDESRRDRWQIKELAAALGTSSPTLAGKRANGDYRCPRLMELWNHVQTQRAAAKFAR